MKRHVGERVHLGVDLGPLTITGTKMVPNWYQNGTKNTSFRPLTKKLLTAFPLICA